MAKKKKVRWENQITAIQERVLVKLSQYKFLTLEQLLRFDDIGTTQYAYLWRQVSSLRDRQKPLVGCNSYNTPNPRKGRVHSIYFLSPNGKKVLENEFGLDSNKIKFKTGKHQSITQYSHRLITVEYHIQLNEWAARFSKEIRDFVAYYDTSSKKIDDTSLRSKLKIESKDGSSFTPDAAYYIEGKKGHRKFHLFELYNGSDLSFIMRQMEPHLESFINGDTHNSFGLAKEPYYLTVLFRYESVMIKFVEQMRYKLKYKSIFNYILVNHLDKPERIWEEEFFNSWVSISNKTTKF